jgi:asparagine synthase (glutamine-hydrolysing)
MCGFCGFILPGWSSEKLNLTVGKMNDSIIHRGPDDAGTWVDADAGIALGHRRLAIVDLSPAGHQPMLSHGGRFVIVFNGEIYNFHELRKELEQQGNDISWRGHSDTEVLLAAIEQWGVETALQRCVGMFSLALWDRSKKCLFLARDRMGEKPLYYGYHNGVFLFASELKALKAHPSWQGEIDRDALTSFLRHNYIPTPQSIYQGIFKLTPGTLLRVPMGEEKQTTFFQPHAYWSLQTVAEAGQAKLFQGNDAEAVEALDTLLRQSVAGQMMADVPLGAFLSGGYDSSMVVALMQTQSAQPVKTFSIGFHEAGYNEAEHAKAVAKHLGTEHTELYVTAQQVMDVIPSLPALYDEPFADSSQMPTYLVSQLAKQHVTVSLSGDGGDELFGGYDRYFLASGLWKKISMLPAPLRRMAASFITKVPVGNWDKLFGILGPVHPSLQAGRAGDRLHKLASILSKSGQSVLYQRLISHWDDPAAIVKGGRDLRSAVDLPDQFMDFVHQMMFMDATNYLPDDILVKVDRAAMGVSLESRIPLLDHRIVEFAWTLPMSLKIRDGQGKWLLRQVLYNYVPKQLLDRPKMGFGVPIDSWLRGPLRDWAETLLEEQRLHQEGFFNAQPIRDKWQEHLSGKRNWQYYLWDILMFQAWLEAERT